MTRADSRSSGAVAVSASGSNALTYGLTGAPGGNWSYNNCDYVVAGALLEAVLRGAAEELPMPFWARAGAVPRASSSPRVRSDFI